MTDYVLEGIILFLGWFVGWLLVIGVVCRVVSGWGLGTNV